MKKLAWIFKKLFNVRAWGRYVRELPAYLRGYALATTAWGNKMFVPFPEFRSVVEKGYIEGGEEDVTAYFDKTITDRDVFFDIGANAGFYTLLANSKGAEVHSFEPFPPTFALLKKNVKRNNRLRKIAVHQVAVSDKNGVVYMEKKERLGLSQISEKGTIQVPSLTLDQFPVVPTIMKVDVEGHELQVFKGGEKMLRKYMPIIVAEGSPEIVEFLTSLGYKSKLMGMDPQHAGNYLFTSVL